MRVRALTQPMPSDARPQYRRLANRWTETCASNSDCPAGHACYPYYYQWDDSYSMDDFDNGVMCMEEDTEKCQDPSDMFAFTNSNFESTGSDYKTTYKCTFAAPEPAPEPATPTPTPTPAPAEPSTPVVPSTPTEPSTPAVPSTPTEPSITIVPSSPGISSGISASGASFIAATLFAAMTAATIF